MKKTDVCQESFKHTVVGGDMLGKWWPNKLNLKILEQNSEKINPNDRDYSYKKAFKTLDYKGLKEDLRKILKESQDWWPADYGHYGPLFIRMAWHSAGTYRIMDGRGGANGGGQRFAPLNSWPDNANLDKARELLWPIKKKYGNKISWADLMILAANVALEDMGFKTLGFAAGREDVWESEIDIYWGEESEWLGDERHKNEKLKNPLAAVQMGLIYVNPEGPNGEPNVLAAAKDIKESFGRMGMNDEETVALIAGGHTFGKNHGAADPSKYLGPEPEGAPIEQKGFGWKNSYKSGKGADTITSGLEGAWTPNPTRWDSSFLEILFKYEWNLVKSPAGAWQWEAIKPDESDMVIDAHKEGIKHKPIMLTTDLALKMDPEFAKISKRFLEDPREFQAAFAKAWFKLTHRDLGPKPNYMGPEIPKEDYIWQDPLPKADHELVNEQDMENLKKQILKSGIEPRDFIYLAWSAASTFRNSDKRGGINGARIRLNPQRKWEVNEPEQLNVTLNTLESIKKGFNARSNRKVSLADLIVLGAAAAIEEASKKGGIDIKVPFAPGYVDASKEQTDEHDFSFLEPVADGFRNYLSEECKINAEEALIDKAQQLNLSVPEMSVLIGGLRVLGITYYNSDIGVLTKNKGILSNDFFVNLLDMQFEWQKTAENEFVGVDRKNGDKVFSASRVDLIFAANSELKAQSQFYAQDDNKEKFVHDFVKAWVKVMENDRFELK